MKLRFPALVLAVLIASLFVACFPLEQEETKNTEQNGADSLGVNDTDEVIDTNTVIDTGFTSLDTIKLVGLQNATFVTWGSTAVAFRNMAFESQVNFNCPANGTLNIVWGTDTYTDDSSVCTAAVHAGKITLAAGGQVSIRLKPGLTAYTASTRNGVSTLAYGTWGYSYIFI